ncbi:MAG TPA: hypothetical protein VHM90_21055 [Phycisphaerae bacterium]|nr:hypothetical protein [Phycisphaerae bacterium]
MENGTPILNYNAPRPPPPIAYIVPFVPMGVAAIVSIIFSAVCLTWAHSREGPGYLDRNPRANFYHLLIEDIPFYIIIGGSLVSAVMMVRAVIKKRLPVVYLAALVAVVATFFIACVVLGFISFSAFI